MSEVTTKQRRQGVRKIKEMTFSNLLRLYNTKQISKDEYRATHTLVLDLEKLLEQMEARDLTWEQLLQFIAQDDKKYYENIFSQP